MTTYRQRLDAGVYAQGRAPATTRTILEAEEQDDPLEGLQCPDCGRTFDSEHGLKIHRTKTHGSTNG